MTSLTVISKEDSPFVPSDLLKLLQSDFPTVGNSVKNVEVLFDLSGTRNFCITQRRHLLVA